MIDVACGAKGVLASGGAGSFIAHATSAAGPDRGFVLRAMATPTTSFGPHLARDAAGSGEFAMVFRVNALAPRAACAGNATAAGSPGAQAPMPPSFSAAPYVGADQLQADPTGEAGQNFYVATAARMAGPWTARRVNVTAASAAAVLGGAGVHISNNALFFPDRGSAAGARGRVGMATTVAGAPSPLRWPGRTRPWRPLRWPGHPRHSGGQGGQDSHHSALRRWPGRRRLYKIME